MHVLSSKYNQNISFADFPWRCEQWLFRSYFYERSAWRMCSSGRIIKKINNPWHVSQAALPLRRYGQLVGQLADRCSKRCHDATLVKCEPRKSARSCVRFGPSCQRSRQPANSPEKRFFLCLRALSCASHSPPFFFFFGFFLGTEEAGKIDRREQAKAGLEATGRGRSHAEAPSTKER